MAACSYVAHVFIAWTKTASMAVWPASGNPWAGAGKGALPEKWGCPTCVSDGALIAIAISADGFHTPGSAARICQSRKETAAK